MAKGDITAFQGVQKARRHRVTSGTAASINAGEPVSKTAGNAFVGAMATSKPVVATDWIVGVSASVSTDTASAAGFVDVYDIVPGQTWLIKPNVAATWNTQALYNALVGSRVLIDLTSSSYTLLAVDGATYGCVVEYIDIVETPGRVCFSFKNATSYLNQAS